MVKQLRYVGRNDQSPAVVSSEEEIIKLCPTLTSKWKALGFIRRYIISPKRLVF